MCVHIITHTCICIIIRIYSPTLAAPSGGFLGGNEDFRQTSVERERERERERVEV